MDNQSLLHSMQDAVEKLREQAEEFRRAQDEHSDESNPANLDSLFHALDDADGAIGDLVP